MCTGHEFIHGMLLKSFFEPHCRIRVDTMSVQSEYLFMLSGWVTGIIWVCPYGIDKYWACASPCSPPPLSSLFPLPLIDMDARCPVPPRLLVGFALCACPCLLGHWQKSCPLS